jgi:hypothetical protein
MPANGWYDHSDYVYGISNQVIFEQGSRDKPWTWYQEEINVCIRSYDMMMQFSFFSNHGGVSK